MHKNFVGGFDCSVCSPPWLPALFNLRTH